MFVVHFLKLPTTMLFYLAIVSGLFLCQQTRLARAGRWTWLKMSYYFIHFTAVTCTTDANEAPTLPTRTGDLLHFLCPLQCTGNHVFEHYNQQAKEMNIIQERPTYEATILIGSHNDAGIYRCLKHHFIVILK